MRVNMYVTYLPIKAIMEIFFCQAYTESLVFDHNIES